MIITGKTKLKEMTRISPILNLTNTDILKECSKFTMPDKIRGITPLKFYDMSFNNLGWLWDIKQPNELMTAIVEIFFYSKLNRFKKWLHKDSEKWAARWLFNAPLIDFYNFANEVSTRIKQEAEEFSKMKLDLSEDEKAAGYGQPDKDSIAKMKDSFARRQGISSLEDAGNYSWTIYKFVFRVDIEEANRQRKYNEIISKKQNK